MHLSLWSPYQHYQPYYQPYQSLSTRLDNLHDINLKHSINFILYVIVLPLSSSFLIGTEKFLYFSVFSPKHSNWPSSEYLVLLLLFQNFFLYHLPHYFYHFQQCQVFFYSSQVVAPSRAPLHIRVVYVVAYVFVFLENLTTFCYHSMMNCGFRSHWPIQWHLMTIFLKEKSLKSNLLSFIGFDCEHCSKFSLLYISSLCVSHSGNIIINFF